MGSYYQDFLDVLDQSGAGGITVPDAYQRLRDLAARLPSTEPPDRGTVYEWLDRAVRDGAAVQPGGRSSPVVHTKHLRPGRPDLADSPQPYRYTYDLEFLEDGRTIDLVSIGIVDVTDPTRYYYAVSADLDRGRFARHEWLVENVLPSLPYRLAAAMRPAPSLRPDPDHPDHDRIKPRTVIAREVAQFLHSGADPDRPIHLWANYSAYDHVALMQLWGPMIARPPKLPMWTHDIQQYAETLGVREADLPQQESGQHNALADALHNATVIRYLDREYAQWARTPRNTIQGT